MTAETITNPSESVASINVGIETLLGGVGFARLNSLGFIRVTGEDRVRWLNGMATNSIQALKPGEGCYNFFLNAQGRIQGDATAWMLSDAILLETKCDSIPALIAHLDHFIIMDDVELTDLSGQRIGLALIGPQAIATLARLGVSVGTPAAGDSLTLTHSAVDDHPVDILHAYSPLAPRLEVWSSTAVIQAITEALIDAGVPEAGTDVLNQLRVLEGTPLYGTDIRDKELPQETGQTRALHFAKGCYLGQEIVERIRSRGNVHRTFSGFILKGPLPAPGTPIFAEASDKPVGELTSAAAVPLSSGTVTIALGYIRREVLDRGIQLTYEGGTATPATLPYNP